MDNPIATLFSIKDLENLSGIKAHTIRIWEQRYDILKPSRTETNYRFYDIEMLQKLLNISLLYYSGFKISKLAKLSEQELIEKVKEHSAITGDKAYFINGFKVAMVNFDHKHFEDIYIQLLSEYAFSSAFQDVFIPLLHNIGLEWQSKHIKPIHEHFISNLILQKLYVSIDHLQKQPPRYVNQVFVLFLPMNEIHEIGLLYIYYELLLKGRRVVYLGQSIPVNDLKIMLKKYRTLHFVSYFTIKPEKGKVKEYLQEMNTELLEQTDNQLSILGRNTMGLKQDQIPSKTKTFDSISSFLDLLN